MKLVPQILVGLGLLLTACTASHSPPGAGASLPFRPGQPWFDSRDELINAHGFCILYHEGRYYWYGSHKIPGRTESEQNEAGIRCYVSSDLVSWDNAGMVLDKAWPGMHPDIAGAGILDRPKVIFHEATQRFIAYFKLYPADAKGGSAGTDVAYVGVATAASPTGPFTYAGKFLGGGSPNGTGDFAIFPDGNGAVFHIGVRKPDKVLVGGRMRADGLFPVGDYFEMAGITLKTEAPALFRRNGRLYLLGSDSTGWAPNAARLFVADSLRGPWKALGNPARGVNRTNGLGPEKTFGGQSTFVLEVPGMRDAYIALFDVWNPQDPVNSGYIWLPMRFEDSSPVIEWQDRWDISVFAVP